MCFPVQTVNQQVLPPSEAAPQVKEAFDFLRVFADTTCRTIELNSGLSASLATSVSLTTLLFFVLFTRTGQSR